MKNGNVTNMFYFNLNINVNLLFFDDQQNYEKALM